MGTVGRRQAAWIRQALAAPGVTAFALMAAALAIVWPGAEPGVEFSAVRTARAAPAVSVRAPVRPVTGAAREPVTGEASVAHEGESAPPFAAPTLPNISPTGAAVQSKLNDDGDPGPVVMWVMNILIWIFLPRWIIFKCRFRILRVLLIAGLLALSLLLFWPAALINIFIAAVASAPLFFVERLCIPGGLVGCAFWLMSILPPVGWIPRKAAAGHLYGALALRRVRVRSRDQGGRAARVLQARLDKKRPLDAFGLAAAAVLSELAANPVRAARLFRAVQRLNDREPALRRVAAEGVSRLRVWIPPAAPEDAAGGASAQDQTPEMPGDDLPAALTRLATAMSPGQPPGALALAAATVELALETARPAIAQRLTELRAPGDVASVERAFRERIGAMLAPLLDARPELAAGRGVNPLLDAAVARTRSRLISGILARRDDYVARGGTAAVLDDVPEWEMWSALQSDAERLDLLDPAGAPANYQGVARAVNDFAVELYRNRRYLLAREMFAWGRQRAWGDPVLEGVLERNAGNARRALGPAAS